MYAQCSCQKRWNSIAHLRVLRDLEASPVRASSFLGTELKGIWEGLEACELTHGGDARLYRVYEIIW